MKLQVTSLEALADSLPGLGIAAAVLGVVLAMGSLGAAPKLIGLKVAAALVGTFIGSSSPTAWLLPRRPAWHRITGRLLVTTRCFAPVWSLLRRECPTSWRSRSPGDRSRTMCGPILKPWKGLVWRPRRADEKRPENFFPKWH